MRVYKFVELFLFLCWSASFADSERILLLPALIRSHFACFAQLGEELVQRGHEVHIVTNDVFGVPSHLQDTKLRFIQYLVGEADDNYANVDVLYEFVVATAMKFKGDLSGMYRNLSSLSALECRRVLLYNEPFMERLEGLKFDITIIDNFFMSDCLYLVPHRLGTPYVSVVDVVLPWQARLPFLPSFVPSVFLPFTDDMTFLERVKNFLIYVAIGTVQVIPPPDADIMVKYSTYGEVTSMSQLASESLFWLYTSDVVLDYPDPTMPNIAHVGGLTVSPGKPLPDELGDYVSASPAGVIVVSFGSMASDLAFEYTEKFFAAFEQLDPIRVIWRFKNSVGLPVPRNVKLMSWLPQSDLLAHPKTRLFVTHCGKNGLYETVYHGVPVVGCPILGDQAHNGVMVKKKGYGEVIDIYAFSAAELLAKIKQVLGDPTYKDRVERASKIFRSRRESPTQRGANWVEHVIEFGGSHLRTHAFNLTWYQYWLVDVLIFLLAVVLLVVWVSWRVLRFLLRCCFGTPKKTKME